MPGIHLERLNLRAVTIKPLIFLKSNDLIMTKHIAPTQPITMYLSDLFLIIHSQVKGDWTRFFLTSLRKQHYTNEGESALSTPSSARRTCSYREFDIHRIFVPKTPKRKSTSFCDEGIIC